MKSNIVCSTAMVFSALMVAIPADLSLAQTTGRTIQKTEKNLDVTQFHQDSQPFRVQKSEKPKFNVRRVEAEGKLLKRIQDARSMSAKIQQARRQVNQIKPEATAPTPKSMKKATLIGYTTRFAEAPVLDRRMIPTQHGSVLTSNLLINGKTNDTTYIGNPMTATFAFASNAVSAVADIYYDVDGDGSVGLRDILLDHLLFIDNDDNDANSALGSYQLNISGSDLLSHCVGSFVVELNDYQTISTATVVIHQKPTTSVVLGSTSPPMSGLLWYLSGISGGIVVASDSTGKFNFYVDRQQVSSITLNPSIDYNGISNGYIPPLQQTVQCSSDTTRIQLLYAPATSFVEGYVRDQSEAGVIGATIQADGPSYMIRTQTDSSGYYKLGLSPGNWYVEPVVSGMSDYLISNSSYQSIAVPPSSTVEQDLQFFRSNSTISGKVKLNNQGAGGIPVYAFCDSLENFALTAIGGAYSVPVYSSSSTSLKYTVNAYLQNVEGYYFPVPSRDNISPGAIDVDFSLSRVTGGLRGRIIDQHTGSPIADANISAQGTDYKSTVSNDTGYYAMSLRDGTYSLYVNADRYFSYSEPNLVVAGSILTRDVALRKSGSISGRVKNLNGVPLLYAFIEAMDSSGYYYYGYSDTSGEFVVSGLTTSKYKIQCSANGYVTQWYDDVTTWDRASAVQVTEGFDTPNINFVLSLGGSISGRTVDNAGNSLDSVGIYVIDSLYSYISYAMTNDSGYYKATGLPTGSYYVEATSQRYIDEWYDNAISLGNAKQVPVIMDHETPNINFVLSLGGSIAGRVRTKQNSAIPYASIYITDSTFSSIAYASANDSGSYFVGHLKPGIKIYVYASYYGYATRWYNNVSSPDLASAIILQEGESRSNIDFVLPVSGGFSGIVRDAGGNPITYAYIDAVDRQGNYVGYGYTDYQGVYQVTNLSGGSYFADANGYPYEQQWFDHKTTLSKADVITVLDEQVKSNINFDLQSFTGAPDTVSIAEARRDDDGNLIPDHAILNDTLAISGVITTPNFLAGINETSYFVQDVTAGIDLFSYSPIGSTLTIGDSVLIVGTVHQYRGSTEFTPPAFDPAHFRILKHNANVPKPLRVTLHQYISNPEKYEGLLIEVDTLYKVSGTWPGPSQNSHLTLRNAGKTDTADMFIDLDTNIDGTSEPQYPVNVIGIASQLSTPPALNNGYSINPCDTGGISHVQGMTGVAMEEIDIPNSYELYCNYPNPFNPSTTISIDLPKESFVTLKVFNLIGQEVRTITGGRVQAGRYRYLFDASKLSSGVYLFQLRAGDFVQTRKMVLMK